MSPPKASSAFCPVSSPGTQTAITSGATVAAVVESPKPDRRDILSPELVAFIKESILNRARKVHAKTRDFGISIYLPGVASEKCIDVVWDVLTALQHKAPFVRTARVSYLSSAKAVIITVPEPGHETMTGAIESLIVNRLREIGFAWGTWGEKCLAIHAKRSASVPLPRGTLQPDGSVYLALQPKHPLIVIETANTQKFDSAYLKIKKYLCGTRGQIRFGILVDLQRAGGNKRKRTSGPGGDEEPNLKATAKLREGSIDEDVRDLEMPDDKAEDKPLVNVWDSKEPYAKASFSLFASEWSSNHSSPIPFVRTIFLRREIWPKPPTTPLEWEISWSFLKFRETPQDILDQKFHVDFTELTEVMEQIVKDDFGPPKVRKAYGNGTTLVTNEAGFSMVVPEAFYADDEKLLDAYDIETGTREDPDALYVPSDRDSGSSSRDSSVLQEELSVKEEDVSEDN